MTSDRVNARGQPICGANRARGGICQSPFVKENGRCRKHGGTARSGPNNPNWKHGRRSSFLPAKVLRAAEQQIGDPHFRGVEIPLALFNQFLEQEASRAINARKPERRATHMRSFGDLAVKRSRMLTEETRRARLSHDAISRAHAAQIMTLFGQAVRDAIQKSAHVTNSGALLAEIQAEWQLKRGPTKTAGVSPAAIGETDQR